MLAVVERQRKKLQANEVWNEGWKFSQIYHHRSSLMSTCTRTLIIHKCSEVEKEIFFLHSYPTLSSFTFCMLIPSLAIISALSRVNVTWKMWNVMSFALLLYMDIFSMNFKISVCLASKQAAAISFDMWF